MKVGQSRSTEGDSSCSPAARLFEPTNHPGIIIKAVAKRTINFLPAARMTDSMRV